MGATKIPKARANGTEIAIASDEGDEGVIGSLVFFTFGSMDVPAKDIDKWWSNQTVLPEAARPKDTTMVDAFMLTCSPENAAIWYKLDSDDIKEFEEAYGETVRTEYVVLPTKDGTNEYILLRRVWVKADTGAKESEISPKHPVLARLKHNAVEDRVDVTPGEDYEGLEIVRQVYNIANDDYMFQKEHVNRAHHVQAFRRLIELEGGCAFGFGSGCMFVPRTGNTRMEKFAEYVEQVARKHTSTSHTTHIRLVPALDNEKMRQDIAEDVARQVQGDFDKLLEDTVAFLRKQEDKKLTEAQEKRIDAAIEKRLTDTERLNGLRKRYEALLERKIEVGKILDKQIPEGLSGRSKAAIRQMAKLMES